MTDPRVDDDLAGVLERLAPAAGDPAREERVKARCRRELAGTADQRIYARRILESAVALISAAYLAQLARLALLWQR